MKTVRMRKDLIQSLPKIDSEKSILSNSLCSYFDSLKNASLITATPDSKVVVIHLPKEVKEIILIKREDFDHFLNSITRLVSKMNDLILSISERS